LYRFSLDCIKKIKAKGLIRRRSGREEGGREGGCVYM
jgi:hypothetical protein